ncbi:NAD(P)-dependent oxidoreductase [Marinicella sp. S1101]|uniref:SDR family oxidoreductase n=1 Tax=Marinicella marina TaxID=2996016 RepID=UPI002260EC6E|nr:NAD(P)-dependent oxidoreductase [Marinicella marina]MCX7553117.1 NAD(P)-dependent oxidoreductase [Marinicella marina]MDJ1138849.1 NAD(P)-dependent oxidoreductase [Marinicella marina]
MNDLHNKTIFITGASRGIGREIALTCAKQGANVVIAAKSAEPHPKLPGTIHTVAEEVEQAGGQALAIQLDVRDEGAVNAAVEQAAKHFGGIDALINNASAIALTRLQDTDVKRFDLIHQINTRGTLVCSKAAIPYLKQSDNGHIITLSPPMNMAKHWLGPFIPYTLSKYGMSLLTLGLAEELRGDGVSACALWPQTAIATAAVQYALDERIMKKSRTPAIMADAALAILQTDDLSFSGQTCIDEGVLRDQGITDFEPYKYDASAESLERDLYLDTDYK